MTFNFKSNKNMEYKLLLFKVLVIINDGMVDFQHN